MSDFIDMLFKHKPDVDLGPYPQAATTATCPKKKVNPMAPVTNEICIETTSAKSDVQVAKDYLFHALREVEWDKDRELRKHFGLIDDDPPENFNEYLQRLKDGKFQLEEKHRTGTRFWRDYLRWRDPDLKEDTKGYKAAKEVFEKDCKATRHVIAVKSPDEGLDALQKLEAWKLRNPR